MRNLTIGDQEILLVVIWMVRRKVKKIVTKDRVHMLPGLFSGGW